MGPKGFKKIKILWFRIRYILKNNGTFKKLENRASILRIIDFGPLRAILAYSKTFLLKH